jgi:hypothetical protein
MPDQVRAVEGEAVVVAFGGSEDPWQQVVDALREERDAARTLARDLLALIETYLRFDYSAPGRVREQATAAREMIAGWDS